METFLSIKHDSLPSQFIFRSTKPREGMETKSLVTHTDMAHHAFDQLNPARGWKLEGKTLDDLEGVLLSIN